MKFKFEFIFDRLRVVRRMREISGRASLDASESPSFILYFSFVLHVRYSLYSIILPAKLCMRCFLSPVMCSIIRLDRLSERAILRAGMQDWLMLHLIGMRS